MVVAQVAARRRSSLTRVPPPPRQQAPPPPSPSALVPAGRVPAQLHAQRTNLRGRLRRKSYLAHARRRQHADDIALLLELPSLVCSCILGAVRSVARCMKAACLAACCGEEASEAQAEMLRGAPWLEPSPGRRGVHAQRSRRAPRAARSRRSASVGACHPSGPNAALPARDASERKG